MRQFATIATGLVLSLSLGLSAYAQDVAQPAPTPETPAEAPAEAPVEPAAPAEAAAPAETPAPAAPAAEAPSEKAKIVFFRPWRLTGGAYTYHVVETGDDGKSTKETPREGSLPNGGAFILEEEPGIHNYNIRGPMADNRAEDRLRMEVEAGETYYVEMVFRMGVITSGFALVPATEPRFTESKADLEKGKKK